MNYANLLNIVQEYIQQTRTFILYESFHIEQGFIIYPQENDLLDIVLNTKGISRTLTLDEVKEYVKSEYCTNKEAIHAFLAVYYTLTHQEEITLNS